MMDKYKEIKRQSSKDFSELTVIVNKWDPMGLIRGGAPDDEYECLTSLLLSQLYQGKSIDELQEFILNQLKSEFELDIMNLKEEYKIRSLNRVKSVCLQMWDWYENRK